MGGDYWKYKILFRSKNGGWNIHRIITEPLRVWNSFFMSIKMEKRLREILGCREEEYLLVKANQIMDELGRYRKQEVLDGSR